MHLDGSICWLRAETHIHVGAGETASLIDLPFIREAGTSYPYVPGSGVKGAWRDSARALVQVSVQTDIKPDEHPFVTGLFGRTDDSGKLLFTDARLVFLPLRALHAVFVLVTCPYLIRRLQRDLAFARRNVVAAELGFLTSFDGARGTPALYAAPESSIVVEDYLFTRAGDDTHWSQADAALTTLLDAVPAATRAEIIGRTVIVSDAAFGHFARRALHVRMRNKLTAETKVVDGGMLWSEESLPPETIMLHVIVPRDPKSAMGAFADLTRIACDTRGYLQVGGNETVGEGWFKVLNKIEAPHAP